MEKANVSPIEKIKQESHGLRGTLKESLKKEITGAIAEDDQAVIKFHGMYQQDDRDLREERAIQKLERLYSFMIRLRLPGGLLKPEQWLAIHHVAGDHATGKIKITTRQTVQLHGIIRSRIKPTIKSFDQAALDSIATCGDINRNVMCSSNLKSTAIHEQVFPLASKISELLMPKTRAYYEIWLDEEKVLERSEEDPLYQERYLPRKFKIAMAIPPDNDVDVFANDIGLIAILEEGQLKGFNIAVGGGLSATHGNPQTYPRLGTVIGYCDGEEMTLKTVYEVLTIQRDFGNRSDRKLARLKYTLDRMGIPAFKKELEKRTGFALEEAKPYSFSRRSDYYGWQQNDRGFWYYTVFVENGVVADTEKVRLKSAFFEVAETGKASFRFTGNQHVILSDISDENKSTIQRILEKYRIIQLTEGASPIRKQSMACVALSTCPLALAEGQRYLPQLISKIETVARRYAVENQEMVIRMTGCPNGCARPYLAEIGLVGTSPGHYNVHLGGDRLGERLNRLYKTDLEEQAILDELDSLFSIFHTGRKPGEGFGDFVHREWQSLSNWQRS
jgi:sulfite reductase (NADPH) hemoprotein beta-component